MQIDGTALNSERVFSSAKETCTLRWNLLSAPMMEILQVLKYLYKQDQLDFTSHWIANEDDYSIDNATAHAINELLNAGKTEELHDLLHNTDKSHSM